MRDLASQINPKVAELLQQTVDSAGSGDGLPNNLVQVSRIDFTMSYSIKYYLHFSFSAKNILSFGSAYGIENSHG